MARVQIIAVLVAAALLAAALGLGAWRWHLIDIERTRAAAEAAREFNATTERIGNADVSTGDADDDLRWLDDRLRRTTGK